MLEPDGELLVGARDYGGGREALGDLLRVVRPGEHGHGPALHDVGEPGAGLRVETPVRPATGASPGRNLRSKKRAAWDGKDDELGVGDRRILQRIAATAERSASGM